MCRLVVGRANVKFRPFYRKTCIWSSNYYTILFWIKQTNINLILIRLAASAWYRSVGRSLCYLKFPFYSVFKLPYSVELFNKIGLSSQNHKHNLAVCKSLCEVDFLRKYDSMQFCLTRGRVFKSCCHRAITRDEFELFNVNNFITFRQLRRAPAKLLLRCTSNHTKRVTRSMVCSSFSNGNNLWDLGSGSAGLSLHWCSRRGKSAVCFEKNELRFKLSFYNVYLVLRGSKRVQFVKSSYDKAIFGASLPDKIFFGCGLKRIWSWKLIYAHLKFGGCAIIVSVSNLGCLCLSLLSSVYSTRSYLLVVHKLKLMLNAKIYTLCSSVFVCVVRKKKGNIW
ncbi:Precorrin-6Y C5,15-methyltransferase [Candidatus Hodgkinia cicadicola]|nr:Precorrin-6Y C5,15-methyltransferase [Candidatus Hodgkinia cicadicola]